MELAIKILPPFQMKQSEQEKREKKYCDPALDNEQKCNTDNVCNVFFLFYTVHEKSFPINIYSYNAQQWTTIMCVTICKMLGCAFFADFFFYVRTHSSLFFCCCCCFHLSCLFHFSNASNVSVFFCSPKRCVERSLAV